MTTLTNFFKESDSTLGVFYPNHYIIATFPTFETTQKAVLALRRQGIAEDEVLAIPGSELLKFFEEFRADSGLWASVLTMLSRSFGTEQAFADADVQSAYAGAGFLAVHSRDEPHAGHIKSVLLPFEPQAMHWYRNGGVECMV